MRRQISPILWLYVAGWLAVFAPLTCYRHGFLPAHLDAERAHSQSVGLPFVIDDMCGTGSLPPPQPVVEPEPHSHVHKIKILLLSALGVWLPQAADFSRPPQPVARLEVLSLKPRAAHLPTLKPPPRLL
ncbi:MAG: hypothetical protein ACK4P1_03755 [Aggregatilineales bacterium]